jgi:hypothetical protein
MSPNRTEHNTQRPHDALQQDTSARWVSCFWKTFAAGFATTRSST